MKAHMACLAALILSLAHGQEETTVTPKVESVAMFKNGLAVVKTAFNVEQPGPHVWVNPPASVHGAFFVQSPPGMVIRSTTRRVDSKQPRLPGGDLQRDLAGAMVEMTLEGVGDQKPSIIQGRVWKMSDEDVSLWNSGPRVGDFAIVGNSMRHSNRRPIARSYGDWLVMEVAGKRRFVATDRISQISIDEEADEVPSVMQPVLIFSAAKAGPVQVTYLTKGMAWMPAYEIDLLAEDRVRLRQTAVVRNELMELKGVELELISGYPNIEFEHVDSALNPQATLSAFFKQLGIKGRVGYDGYIGQSIATQSILNNPSRREIPETDLEVTAPTDDLHYQSIGVHEMAVGDSLSLEVAAAEAKSERVVEWLVPDGRNDHGNYRNDQKHDDEHDPWDVILFDNPLEFPMTTAAASTLEQGRFLGQSMSTWTARGKQASIRIGKALTVRTEYTEIEEEKKREPVDVWNRRYYQTTIKGTLKLHNMRSKPVKMVIRNDFSGELLEADGEPESHLRPEGARSVNPRRQLKWEVDLKAGEAKSLNYRYSLLVYR